MFELSSEKLNYLHTKHLFRRPFGVEGEFFVQLFLESEANSDAIPSISDMLHRMFTEQDLSFTKVSTRQNSTLRLFSSTVQVVYSNAIYMLIYSIVMV